jgi:type I restriction enzyme S subunit
MKYGLSDKQLQEIKEILASYESVEKAVLFGSRAIDTYKEASDVDIAIKGEKADWSLAITIKEHLEEETYLPFFFDVVAYGGVESEELKQHIDGKGKVLFERGMSEWREYKLGDIGTFSYGKMPKKDLLNTGDFPTFSGYKYQYTYPESNCNKNDLIVVARGVGGTGDVKIVREDCYLTNLSLKMDFDSEIAVDKFVYYFYSIETLRYLDSGSAQSQITITDLSNAYIPLPPLPEQKAIAEVLSSLDDKIDLLHRQNKTLEQMAETLFRQWFVEEAGEDWGEKLLGDVIEIYDSKRIPLSKMQRNKMKEGVLYPYYGAATIMDYVNDYIFDGDYILLGEDGTVRTNEGYPVLQYATGKFWVNNHTHIFKAKAPYNNFFIWNFLSKKNIDRIITGAVQPKINQTNLKSLEFPDFPEDLVNEYIKITDSQFEKILKNSRQIRTLESLRDTLLPKLMSGEVRIASNG